RLDGASGGVHVGRVIGESADAPPTGCLCCGRQAMPRSQTKSYAHSEPPRTAARRNRSGRAEAARPPSAQSGGAARPQQAPERTSVHPTVIKIAIGAAVWLLAVTWLSFDHA